MSKPDPANMKELTETLVETLWSLGYRERLGFRTCSQAIFCDRWGENGLIGVAKVPVISSTTDPRVPSRDSVITFPLSPDGKKPQKIQEFINQNAAPSRPEAEAAAAFATLIA